MYLCPPKHYFYFSIFCWILSFEIEIRILCLLLEGQEKRKRAVKVNKRKLEQSGRWKGNWVDEGLILVLVFKKILAQ